MARLGSLLLRFSTGLSWRLNWTNWLMWQFYQLILTVREIPQAPESVTPLEEATISPLSGSYQLFIFEQDSKVPKMHNNWRLNFVIFGDCLAEIRGDLSLCVNGCRKIMYAKIL